VLYLYAVFVYIFVCLCMCKNRLPYNLYCVGGDVKHCTIQFDGMHENCDFDCVQSSVKIVILILISMIVTSVA